MNTTQTTTKAARHAEQNDWTPIYEKWRHGGWYVVNVQHPSGACGCVSNNYADRKWRIVCAVDHAITFPSRDAAARAERRLSLGQRF